MALLQTNGQQTNELWTMTEIEKKKNRDEILCYQQMSQVTMKTFDKYEKITKGNLANVDVFVEEHREKRMVKGQSYALRRRGKEVVCVFASHLYLR